MVTSSIAEAIDAADLILCPAPAFAQSAIAELAAPHLRDGQVVFLPPGTFGSYIFARAARDAGNRAEFATAETGTLPWLARKQGPCAVRISGRGARLPTGVFPLRLAPHALEVIERAFPDAIEPCGDALSGALMNAGPIIHPPLITMNAGPIEHFEKWDIHKEGTQAAIRRVTDALDAERIAIREALGYGGPHFPLADHYSQDGEAMDVCAATRTISSPIPAIGRAPRSYRASLHAGGFASRPVVSRFRRRPRGRATPLVQGVSGDRLRHHGTGFRGDGRSLSSLGLGDLDRAALQTLLVEGFDETGHRMPWRRTNGPRDCGRVRFRGPSGRRR